jgi:hypothetical protein
VSLVSSSPVVRGGITFPRERGRVRGVEFTSRKSLFALSSVFGHGFRESVVETAVKGIEGRHIAALWWAVVGWSQRNERGFMMNHADGWMGGGMWIWTVIGVLVVVLLVVLITKVSKN